MPWSASQVGDVFIHVGFAAVAHVLPGAPAAVIQMKESVWQCLAHDSCTVSALEAESKEFQSDFRGKNKKLFFFFVSLKDIFTGKRHPTSGDE